jgi:hypothetical protein
LQRTETPTSNRRSFKSLSALLAGETKEVAGWAVARGGRDHPVFGAAMTCMRSDYTAADLVYDLIGRTLEETRPDPARDNRRNHVIAMMVTEPSKNNFLIAEPVEGDRVALALGYRSKDGQLVTGEVIIPRASWNPTLFTHYAKSMSRRPH